MNEESATSAFVNTRRKTLLKMERIRVVPFTSSKGGSTLDCPACPVTGSRKRGE